MQATTTRAVSRLSTAALSATPARMGRRRRSATNPATMKVHSTISVRSRDRLHTNPK